MTLPKSLVDRVEDNKRVSMRLETLPIPTQRFPILPRRLPRTQTNGGCIPNPTRGLATDNCVWRGSSRQCLRALDREWSMQTKELRKTIYPEFEAEFASANPISQSTRRHFNDIDGIEKVGRGEWDTDLAVSSTTESVGRTFSTIVASSKSACLNRRNYIH